MLIVILDKIGKPKTCQPIKRLYEESTIENLKTCQPREQNMQLSFDKRCSFPAQNSAFSLGQTRLMSGKLSRLKSKHTRKNRHASGLNENGSKNLTHLFTLARQVQIPESRDMSSHSDKN